MENTKTLSILLNMLRNYDRSRDEAIQRRQTVLRLIWESCSHVFEIEGQCYQVCRRMKEGTFFLKTRKPSKTLLTQQREAGRYRSTPDLAVPEQSFQVEVESSACGADETLDQTPDASSLPLGADVAAVATE